MCCYCIFDSCYSASSGKCDPCGACRPKMASPGKRINIQDDGLFRQFDKFISCIHCSTPESSRSDNVYELALTLGQYPNTYSQKLYKCDESALDYHKSSQNLKRKEVLPYLFPRTTLALSGRLEPSKAILEMMLCPHCYTLGETRIDEFKEIRNRQVELGQVCSASDGSMLKPDLLPEARSGGALTYETERDRTSVSLKAQSSQSDLLIRNRISGSAPDLHEISRIDGQIGKIHHIRSTLEVLPNRHALYVAMT